MYIVSNLTTRTVILSDLRVEIGPKKVIDLEQIADRADIDKSHDLRQALSGKRLAITRHSVIKAKKTETKIIQPAIDEDKLANMIRKVISEEMKNKAVPSPAQQPSSNIEDTVHKAVSNSVGSLMSELRDRINSFQPPNIANVNEPSINPEKLAEISQKSVEKIAQDIETNDAKKGTKVKIVNRRLDDLANELM